MLDQLSAIMLAVAITYGASRFLDGFFRAFDQLDAVIVRWMREVRFRR